jgi:hypothetical protein
MNEFSPPPDETEIIGPSWLNNGFMALGCVILAVALFRLDAEVVKGAPWMAAFLIFGALVILSAHLPGATGVWLDREGFLVRDMYKSTQYRWDEVGPFMVRRKMLGKAVEFSYRSADSDRMETRGLPRGVGGSVWSLAKKMNDWRGWACGPEE